MDKVISFHTHDNLGRCFAEAIDLKPSSGMTKVAGNLDPELQSFIKSIKPDPRYQYVLMTPMGAFEYWGMNVNGDVFPEVSLSHCCRDGDPAPVIKELEDKYLKPHGKSLPMMPLKDFGFRTFENALRYKHHVNKNPDIAYGDIVFVTYNKPMHRVELVVRHDRRKAKQVGAEQIIIDIDNGKPRQISMGCKVPFDVCTVCGNVSRTTSDYCVHLKNEMGKVRPDGTVVGAINFFPRFFDLSDVFVPAAKESGVLMKVASARGTDITKTSAYRKLAEVKKTILPNAISEKIMQAQDCEPDIPSEMLRKVPMSKLLGTMSMLGMVAKPREFQYGMLNSMGMPNKAEEYRRKGIVFNLRGARPSGPPPEIRSSSFSPMIASLLSKLIPVRSGFEPHLQNRIIRITIIKKPNIVKEQTMDEPILNKIASAYHSYRKSLQTIPKNIDNIIDDNSSFYYKNFFRDTISDSMVKLSSVKKQSFALPYMHNVYYDTKEMPSWGSNISKFSKAQVLLGSLQGEIS